MMILPFAMSEDIQTSGELYVTGYCCQVFDFLQIVQKYMNAAL